MAGTTKTLATKAKKPSNGTSNTNLITLIVEHLESLLQGKLNDLDKQVLEFEL